VNLHEVKSQSDIASRLREMAMDADERAHFDRYEGRYTRKALQLLRSAWLLRRAAAVLELMQPTLVMTGVDQDGAFVAHLPIEVRSREALAELMGWHVPEERGPETEREVPDAPDPEGTL